MSGWLRVGNFYNNCLRETLFDVDMQREIFSKEGRAVSFISQIFDSAISQINIEFSHSQNIHNYHSIFCSIELSFSPIYMDEILTVCNTLKIGFKKFTADFTKYTCDENKSAHTINGDDITFISGAFYTAVMVFTPNNLAKIVQFMQIFNHKKEHAIFPQSLIDELNRILTAVKENIFEDQNHLLPEATQITPSKDQQLADLIAFSPDYKKFKHQLLAQTDPNEPHKHYNYRPLDYAVLAHTSTKYLELLLWYGGNPFSRPIQISHYAMVCYSAYELAISYQQYDKAEVIKNAVTKPSKPLVTPIIKNWIARSSLNKVVVQFTYDDGNIFTTLLKRITDIKAAEYNEILKLFVQTFSAVTGALLFETFKRDFSGNKLIDIIFLKDKIIGFNLFEIIDSPTDTNMMHVNCWYAALDSKYRGNGLMLLLSSRLAYALQTIVDKNVGVLFLAIDYNSYRLVQSFEHFPKYQNAYLKKEMAELVKQFYPSTESVSDLLTQYVPDDISVRTKPAHQNPNRILTLNERIYRNEILACPPQDSEKSRGAPVLYFIGDKTTAVMTDATTDTMRIDFKQHIYAFAQQLLKSTLISSNKKEPDISKLNISSTIFFHPQYQPTQSQITSSVRAKL